MPFTDARTNPLGVLHKAEIIEPGDSERRIVDSIMPAAGGPEEVGEDRLREFVAAEEISKKFDG